MSCSNISDNESDVDREVVVFDDGHKGNEIVIEDKDFDGKIANPASIQSSEEITKIGEDNSKISITTDRYGNKVEIRTFNSDPRLSLVMLRTSADRKTDVFVYGKDGEIKSVPENMRDRLMTASAKEIALAAGINEPLRESFPVYSQDQRNINESPLEPLPSSEFPITAEQNQSPTLP